jgi:hypothetical protein
MLDKTLENMWRFSQTNEYFLFENFMTSREISGLTGLQKAAFVSDAKDARKQTSQFSSLQRERLGTQQ